MPLPVQSLLLCAVGLAVGLAVLPGAAAAATIVVNDTGDGTACVPSGACTLRGALLLANSNGSDDTIVFAGSGGPLVFTPATPLPTITDALIIDGFDCNGCGSGPLDNGNDV